MRAAAIAALLLLATAPARAQRCEADLETCAREAYASGQYALALARFRAMIAEGETPALRLAVAQCLFQLGRFEEALTELAAIPADAAVADQAGALRELARAGLGAPRPPPDPSAPDASPPPARLSETQLSETRPPETQPPETRPSRTRPNRVEPTRVAPAPASPADRPDAPPSPAGSGPSWLLWTGLGATAAGTILAIAAGIPVLDARNDWDNLRCVDGSSACDAIRGRYELAAPFATAGFVLGGLGLGLIVLELALDAAGVDR